MHNMQQNVTTTKIVVLMFNLVRGAVGTTHCHNHMRISAVEIA